MFKKIIVLIVVLSFIFPLPLLADTEEELRIQQFCSATEDKRGTICPNAEDNESDVFTWLAVGTLVLGTLLFSNKSSDKKGGNSSR